MDNPVRRKRSWYKRRVRNQRILVGIAVVAVIGIVSWLGPALFPMSEVGYSRIETAKTPRKPHQATPEELGKMASQGDAEAQWRLGALYRDGDGVRQSDAEAVEWFQRAAEQKYVPALSALGSQYWAGRGVRQDYNKAYFWYDLALAQGGENAESQLQDLASELTSDEVANAHQQAKAWLQAHGCTIEHP